MRTLLALMVYMDDLSKHFFIWLAAAPAFVQVVLGVGFNLIIAPAVLATVATGVTWLEHLFERFATGERGAAAFYGIAAGWNKLQASARHRLVNVDSAAASFVVTASVKQTLLMKAPKL
ncbi:MAG: hypothetical protein ABI612_12205 [Betaproteobacteria bacterium]